MHSLTLVTPPDSEPITLEEAKTHLRVEQEFEDDDEYITGLIKVARQEIEAESDNVLKRQGWLLTLDGFPCGEVIIRKHPVIDVDSIQYIDGDSVRQTLDPALYQVDLTPHYARVRPAFNQYWPIAQYLTFGAVEIRFTAGHEDRPEGIPETLIHAIKMRLSEKYEHREDSIVGTSITPAVATSQRLVALHRVPRV